MEAKMKSDDDILLPEEAAAELRLKDLKYPDPVKTLKAWARKKIIGCTHIGKKVVFTRAHIRDYLSREKSIEHRPRRRRRSHNVPERST